MAGWWRALAAIIMACGVMIAGPIAAHPAWQSSLPVVELTAGEDGPELANAIAYTKDIGPVSVPIERMLELPLRTRSSGAEHFGSPGQRTALALNLRNTSAQTGTWILTTGRGSLSHFRLYTLTDDAFTLILDGTDPAAAQANLRAYQAFSTELTLNPGESRIIVVDFLSDNSTYLPLKLETFSTFFQKRRANIALVAGVVLGIAVLVFINSLFFSITGYREFGWLALAQAGFAISTIHTEGYLTIFLLADSPLLSVAIEDGIKCGFTAAMAQFARTFLKTHERFARLDKTLLVLIVIALVVIALQCGLALYSPAMRGALHAFAWAVTASVALFLPLVGVLAVRHIGRQMWPLLVGWGSLAGFIIYGAVASMGVFSWLPINWHSIGPVGLFEVLMVTLALGLNLRKIEADRREADARYAQSIAERLAISERAARLAEERQFALTAVENQNALLHASGHDSRQVILALNSAISVLKRSDAGTVHRELAETLQSSADYLSEIAATTMSGATTIGRQTSFVALSAFRAETLIEPLLMMFKGPFAGKGLSLDAAIGDAVTIISDRPLLMRALANLLSNSLQHTAHGGARLMLAAEDGHAVITLADTGSGMTKAIAQQLMHGQLPRSNSAHTGGTGSGFGSARQIIEGLGGSLTIASSDPSGTTVQIRLCCAFAAVTPCSQSSLGERLAGWQLADFDQRGPFEALIAGHGPAEAAPMVATTHDDTSITRGRLSETAALMLIKPLVLEMAAHPAFRNGLAAAPNRPAHGAPGRAIPQPSDQV
jgi:signal transduction histidine kinase